MGLLTIPVSDVPLRLTPAVEAEDGTAGRENLQILLVTQPFRPNTAFHLLDDSFGPAVASSPYEHLREPQNSLNKDVRW